MHEYASVIRKTEMGCDPWQPVGRTGASTARACVTNRTEPTKVRVGEDKESEEDDTMYRRPMLDDVIVAPDRGGEGRGGTQALG
jgi:hypothetical protein